MDIISGEQQKYGTLLNMSMVHVDDVARAHINILMRKGETFILHIQ